jgi:hypothetical protein
VTGQSTPDDELLEELRTLLGQADPPPPEVTEFARAALGWRQLDADLAELLADSALEREGAGATRSTGTDRRRLTFRAPALSIDLEISAEGDRRYVSGQLAPPSPASTVEVQAVDGSIQSTVEADELGRFRVELGTTGPIRLRVFLEGSGEPDVVTSWFSI